MTSTTRPSMMSPWHVCLLGSAAGAMAWGIRGQYGHETGAMIAGLLVSLSILLKLGSHLPTTDAVRAAALCTIAMGFGGSMTYGQTVGLTHDAPLVGNWAAWRWGMLGLALKGGIWIAFAGLFLGIGLGGIRYRSIEMLGIMIGALVLYGIGVKILNSPFDPTAKILPMIYFSDDWRWEPDAALRPRPECWGGLLFAWAGIAAYAGWVRKDVLARRLAIWGFVGGALGFPLGQSIQSWHAWNPELFATGPLQEWGRHINWWNFMETTFGGIMGGFLAWGAWRNRDLITASTDPADTSLPISLEWILAAIHIGLLVLAEFTEVRWAGIAYDPGLVLGLIPLVAVASGRVWPWLVVLPVTLLPIAGKTLSRIIQEPGGWNLWLAWFLLGVAPLLVSLLLYRLLRRELVTKSLTPKLLASVSLIYWLLNFVFFRFPFPWEAWTSRTPNGLVFLVCLLIIQHACWKR